MSLEFREAVLEHWISQGLTVDEMCKQAELCAEVLEAMPRVEKQAAPGAAASPDVINQILGFISSRLGNVSDTAIQTTGKAVANVSPLVLAGSVALPIAAGYYGGDMAAKLTDPGKSKLDEMKRQEEIAELKAQTARLQQQRRVKQQYV